MEFNTSGYLAYKKNKIKREIQEAKKPISRLSFLFQLFVATFIIMFIIIVVAIMKYSSKMDIEYTKGEIQISNAVSGNIGPFEVDDSPQQQRKIDKRLFLIQQEENAPSEAKIVNKGKNYVQVIDPVHVEENKKREKLEKQKQIIEKNQSVEKKPKVSLFEDSKSKKIDEVVDITSEANVVILSKVLVGRYNTFEEATALQNEIKISNPELTPFVRKVGSVYCVQMGSYQDFTMAKEQAHKLRNKGFDVWIYQQ